MNKLLIPKADYIRNDLQMYPHIPDKHTKHDTRYNPDTYISIQTKVNNDSKFEKNYISKIVADGWVALKNVNDILLFPNPTPGNLNIDLNKTYKEVKVIVRNIVGQEILSKQYHNTRLINLEIKGSPGLYLVEIQTKLGETKIIKVVKQ